MGKFQADTLSVNIAPPATAFFPLEGRKYTLSQSEFTGKFSLFISNQYSIASINPQLTTILKAEWITFLGEYALKGIISLGGSENDERLTQVRYMIYQKELPELIRLLIMADNQFLKNYPLLLDSPIIIQYDSPFQEFNGTVHLGTPRQFLLKPVIT
ncbi:staygreen family protein [Bacillus sp. FJAT-49736]|uniref:staygreen family protein n=1 Tax=Bacillus sp. FJAT-49736 TaxID=2833582 RepID=UPI001BCA664B|nr:hypothetical protein [Bacillus sp. FJAT-49736]